MARSPPRRASRASSSPEESRINGQRTHPITPFITEVDAPVLIATYRMARRLHRNGWRQFEAVRDQDGVIAGLRIAGTSDIVPLALYGIDTNEPGGVAM